MASDPMRIKGHNPWKDLSSVPGPQSDPSYLMLKGFCAPLLGPPHTSQQGRGMGSGLFRWGN
jgi:hypothetical protein